MEILEKAKIIILVGRSGSGKGTQGQFIKKFFEEMSQEEWTKDIILQKKFRLYPPEVEVSYDEAEVKQMLPALLRTYIAAGAVVVPSPAFDQEFECMDFLTVLDLTKLNKSFERRYFL